MNVLRGLILTVVGLAIMLGIVGLFLPRASHVERSVSISAPADNIYQVVSDLRQFNSWSPWASLDPDTTYEFSGNGVGSNMSWHSDDPSVGSGSMTITALVPGNRVEMDLDFGEAEKATSYISLDPDGDNTNVVWGFDTQFGVNPYYRYFGLMMDKMVGGSYEKGLSDLKALMDER